MEGDRQTCRVWVADLSLVRPEHDRLLDDTERARAAAFLGPDDRARFRLGAVLVRHAVAEATDTDAASLRLDRRCPDCGQPHGRLRVAGSDVHVSVSHSGSVVLAAVTWAGPVGVDVEDRSSDRALPRAARVLSPQEPLQRQEDLLTYWCRKEAVAKATGEGLRVLMRDIVVSPADEPARLVRYPGRDLSAWMTDLEVAPSYAAALAVLTSGPVTVEVQRADALLS